MLHAVIMAGGAGTRFWPASRLAKPKQLLNLVGERTMIQESLDRVAGLVAPQDALVVTNQSLVDAIREQLPSLPAEAVIGEPCKRDTAPCIGLASAIIALSDADATMVVMPADHVIRDTEAFHSAVRHASELVSRDPTRFVTFGIRPSYPAESFGYIERGEPLTSEDGSEVEIAVYPVKMFREKPSVEVAERYLATGGFYWNSGIFVWKARSILEALAAHEPAMHQRVQAIAAAYGSDSFGETLATEFAEITGKSIDYAVMEKYDNVVVIEAPFDWDDVGNWRSLTRQQGTDDAGNTVIGRHLALNSSGCIVRSSDEHLVVTLGMQDCIVVHTPDATLVARKHDEEAIRQVVEMLKEKAGIDICNRGVRKRAAVKNVTVKGSCRMLDKTTIQISFTLGMLLMICPFKASSDERDAADSGALRSNVGGPTFGGKQFWTDELIFHQWRIQRHAWTGHYRLLDDEDFRRAWGSFEDCRERLDALKQELTLPPMRGKVVVALHGLVRSRQSMRGICDYLHEYGDYTVVNFSYASTRNEIGQHARSFASVMQHLGPEVTEINLVAHSLGNLVIRHYLGDQTKPDEGQRPDPRIKRIVMLAPPNNGAEFARKFADNKLFQAIWGKSGLELANEWESLKQRLAVPAGEFAILAGGKGESSGNNPLLTGDDDFVVSVEETRLPGASDFKMLPVLHSLIMDDPKAREYTLRFFWHGYLIADDEREPIPRDPANGRRHE